ncbi:MAG: helix-turn-helix transcriptional regulator [Bacteroidales bacterium]|nr:helix-turn-helix transcriptional regulator [Bacteroidales bacterium]
MYQLATTMPFMVCLVWTAILLFQIGKADRAHIALAVFGIVTSALYFCHYLHFNGLQSRFSESLYYLCNLSVYPLYALYVKCLTGKSIPRTWTYLWWFIPAVAVFVCSLAGWLQGIGGAQMAAQAMFPVVTIYSSIIAARDLFRFRLSVNNFYSNPEEKRLDPLFILLVLLVVTAMMSFTVNLLGRDHFMGSWELMIPSVGFSALLFSIFYFGNKTEFPADEVRVEDFAEGFSDSDDSSRAVLMEKIRAQMQAQQLFRSKGLTVADLAEAVGSNRTYVSACINQLAKQSFSDYVNSWRIRYARLLMEEKPPLSITEVADRSGFSDRVSFYRSFKKITGMSPSEWMEHKG